LKEKKVGLKTYQHPVQDGPMPAPSNDSSRNLNPDANIYAPRTDAGEVNLNAIEISLVN
jgi:hypothetical protein